MIEKNVITPLAVNPVIHGGYIKVVGTSFRNTFSSFPRHVIIREFFERVTSKSTYSSNLINFCRDINIKVIKEIYNVHEDMSKYIKVKREPNNRFDPNAIAVYVNTGLLFTKVGFFPKDLAEFIVVNEFNCYVVGFEKSGRGILLTMIFTCSVASPIHLESKVLEQQEEENAFEVMSLSKIRKKLCIQ